MREISAIDQDIEAAEARLLELKRERTGARLPLGYEPALLKTFAEAFHDADTTNHGSAHVELADGINVRINVSVIDEDDGEVEL